MPLVKVVLNTFTFVAFVAVPLNGPLNCGALIFHSLSTKLSCSENLPNAIPFPPRSYVDYS